MGRRDKRPRFRFLWPNLLSRRSARADVDAELHHHLRERGDALIGTGMSPDAASDEAERLFGDIDRVRRTCERIETAIQRTTNLAEFLRSVLEDLRHGVRIFRTSPGLSAALILTLGLGIGASVAVFSVADAILWRPLPYAQPDRLVSVFDYDAERDRRTRPTTEQGIVWQRESAAAGLVSLTLSASISFVRSDGDEPSTVMAQAVSANWLETLGVEPRVGRSFSALESQSGTPGVVILSDGFWRAQLGSDSKIYGRVIMLDERPYTVIGVMASGFKFPATGPNDVWVPMALDGTVAGREFSSVSLLARLPEGVDVGAAQDRLNALGAHLQEADPRPAGWQVRTKRLDAQMRALPDFELALWTLMGAAAVLLLIAAVNAANLLLVHAHSRQHRIAVRMALGASRGRLVRQLLIETLVPVVVGGTAGIALARVAVAVLGALLPGEATLFVPGTIAIDARVLLFAVAVTAAVGVTIGLSTAFWATRAGAVQLIAVPATPTHASGRIRNLIVATEVALSVILLVGAGLLAQSFLRLTTANLGYEPENLVLLSLYLPDETYLDESQRLQLWHRLRDRVAGLPGVESVSLADGVPQRASAHYNVALEADGRAQDPVRTMVLPKAAVDPAYFQTLGLTLVAGRTFNAGDTPETGNVIIDRDLAASLWGSENAIGRSFRVRTQAPWLTVVGVVDDLKLFGWERRQGPYTLLYPLPGDRATSRMSLAIRSSRNTTQLLPSIRQVVHGLDPRLPIEILGRGPQLLAQSAQRPRFLLRLVLTFASVGLALAVVGVYGVLAFEVGQRNRELGIRVALGASSRSLTAMVLRRGIGLTGVGVLVGLGIAALVGRLVGSLLFEIDSSDPVTLAGVAALMLASAAAACWLPARRATRVDPVEALRAL